MRVSVVLEDGLLVLNRAVGVLRRRHLPVGDLAVKPSGMPGLSRLTFLLETDPATADRVAQQFHKIVGVREVVVARADDEPSEEGKP
ncbi:MAG TPA: hypothetical protein VNI61_06815 [Gemmatimonadales bacterium]|nr:hypothetical protein [Gemmatimonadales bacterium]